MLSTNGIGEFLQELAVLVVTTLPHDLFCGITLRRDGRALTAASSDERAAQVDEVQYQHERGPCLSSVATGEAVQIDELATDERWGTYQVAALAHGVRASLSLPLRTGEETIGAMNIYSSRPNAFTPEDRLRAEQLAVEASRALTLAVRMAEASEMSEHLQAALASRAVIDQALGFVMGQPTCTADAAVDILRSIYQNRNLKLRDIAGEIVAAISGQSAAAAPRFHRGPH